jgi:hypothetical protein
MGLSAVIGDALLKDRDWLAALWRGFYSKWTSPHLRGTLKALTELYVEAASHTAAEAGLVIAQVVLELLAWTLVVHERGMMSSDGYERLAAADRIRLLLAAVGGTRDLDPTQDSLTRAARANNWVDGPQAVTELRNIIVHPQRRERLVGMSPSIADDARALTLNYAQDAVDAWLQHVHDVNDDRKAPRAGLNAPVVKRYSH